MAKVSKKSASTRRPRCRDLERQLRSAPARSSGPRRVVVTDERNHPVVDA